MRGTTRRWACGTPRGANTTPPGPDAELLLADLEDVLALEHVEELVLALVDVERRVDRVALLEER